MQEQFRLLSVHAHPDDESSKGSGTVAKYSDAGIRNVLVCCTGGEEGDILNEEMNRPEVIENLRQVRHDELTAATDIIGYADVIMLGYRDSGMKDSDTNENPDCFAAAPLDEAVARLATIVRAERPHVVMSYGPARGGYEHPRTGGERFDDDRRRAMAGAEAGHDGVVSRSYDGDAREVPRARP